MGDDNTEIVKQSQNNTPKRGGFDVHPENINRGGRPKKGKALTDLMMEMLEETPEIKKAIMARLLKGAADGDIAFIREVLDRLEGKPMQSTDITSGGESLVTKILDYGSGTKNLSTAETEDSVGEK